MRPRLNEETLLNRTLQLLREQGAEAAYAWLTHHAPDVDAENRGQIYNYQACLAARCGEADTALAVLARAIAEGCWWRPEVWDDEDLEPLWGHPEYEALRAISAARHARAAEKARWQRSWQGRQKSVALVALHGNHQHAGHARQSWQGVGAGLVQVETLQSNLPDSAGLWRWEPGDESENRLAYEVDTLRMAGHTGLVLGGYSAGCNSVVHALLRPGVKCEAAILVAPWLPGLPALDAGQAKALARTRLLVVCGLDDEACLPAALRLAAEAKHAGGHCDIQLIHSLGHAFPGDFAARGTEFMVEGGLC